MKVPILWLESMVPSFLPISLDGGFSLTSLKWFLLPDIVHEQRVLMPSMKELVLNWLRYDLLKVLAFVVNTKILVG